jgi:hypothetical protein
LETDPFKKGRSASDIHPFLSGFFDGKKYQIFWGKDCVQKFLEAVRKSGLKLIYFHNGGNFDFHFMLEFLPVEDCKFLCIGKRIVSIKTPWGVEFRDSYAIIPKPLKAYGKTEIDYRKFEAALRGKWKESIIEYLKDDLRYLYEMCEGFLKRFPAEMTLASATFKLLQKEFGADIGRTDENYDKKFRPFFFGGRVQFWQLGRVRGKCHTVDINSSYPYAMAHAHPHGGEFSCGTKMPRKNAEQSFFVVEGISDGELPLRNKKGGIEFPVGRHVFWLTGWELLAALELKKFQIINIETVYTPDEVKDFGKFVHEFYDAKVKAKREGDKASEFFFKIVLNAGYGKTALNVRKFSEVAVTSIYDTPPDIDGRSKKQKKANAELAGWQVKWDDPTRGLTFHSRSSYRPGIDKFINVATAASITGFARAYLMRSIAKCKGVVYCDTDSVTAADVSALPQGEGLGQWKLETTFPGTTEKNSFWIAGKKLYAGFGTKPNGVKEWKTASKGVRLAPEKIIDVAKGKQRTHESIAPTFSVFSPPKFVRRRIRRADKRNH